MRRGDAARLHRLLKASMNTAEALNHACQCITLNSDRLREQLESDPSLKGMAPKPNTWRPSSTWSARCSRSVACRL